MQKRGPGIAISHVLFGANYVMGYAVTPTEMWQADTTVPGANTFDMSRH